MVCLGSVFSIAFFRILARLVLYFVFSARLVVVARVLRGRVIVELRERESLFSLLAKMISSNK